VERAILAERLAACGLSPKEAQVFLEVSLAGPGKASEVARRTGLSRTDAYNQLKRLVDRGVVRATVERPMRFVPLPIDDALDVLVKEREDEIQRIRSQRDVFRESIKPLPQVDGAGVEATFRLHQDRRTIHNQIHKMIRDARSEVLIAATKRSLGRYASSGILAELRTRSKAVRIRVLTQVDGVNLDAVLEAVQDADYLLRHSDRVGSNLLIVDGKEILNSLVFDDAPGSKGREDVALWTDSADFVRAQRAFFEEAWEESVHLEERKTEIRTGRVVEPIKAYIGEGSMYERFRKILEANPEGLTEVNAHLLKQGTTYGLRQFGIEPAHIFNLIGNRIGQEIAHELKAKTRQELWRELKELWRSLGLGQMKRLKREDREDGGVSEPGVALKVDHCFSCRGMPKVGHPICAVDEGIIQGVIEARLGVDCRIREAECRGKGDAHCLYVVRFLDEDAARAAEAEKTARTHMAGW
jgi:sugar-specific transcriptional regulator TrmB/predicted hydrocarbon binding protein